ncbi:cyclase family protein [Halanaerobium hydrogeniformans]|uniref:Cyclase family protein n=1 Tax=Halanaerobium hydrogeniformans TaxID=656519 RepID=E4RK59_HALHG|nr:cyclase family protein [Halanaerobium hydrogeniformans]ADQ14611.1 cyclase family protein [Halanaerobium hydrogeniformans]
MKKLIDLSHEIRSNMPVYPGDRKVNLEKDRDLEKDEYINHNLSMGMHVGTHIDLPMHMIKSNYAVSDLTLNKLSGPAKLIYAKGEKVIQYKSAYEKLIKKDDIVIIYTGFAEKFNSQEYYHEHPLISKGLAEFFAKKEINILAFDMPSPDKSPYEIHKILFKKNILILENLCNLEKLLGFKKFNLFIFPLKVKTSGAPVRVAAELP